MDIEQALEKYLKYDADVQNGPALTADQVAALIALKALRGEQVCGGIVPQGWKSPYQTYGIVSDPAEDKKWGKPCPRYSIDHFALTKAKAKQMLDLTYNALAGFGGIMGGINGVKVEAGIYQETSWSYEQDTKLYHYISEFVLLYRD